MASIKYKTNEGYVSIPLNIIGSRVYLEDYDDGEVVPELVDDNAKLGNGIGTCSTSSGTALEVTLDNYKLVKNGIIAVTFENDVPANATLNINNKGAKAIYNEGSAIEADVIKAGKTVMFAYDGTNYVVTSLGGGGITVWPEFVTISLTQFGGSDSTLIGATIVVTDDDTSDTILSTTWDGSYITVQVDVGVSYTVTVGSISDFIIRQNTQSYKAISGLARLIEFSYIGNVVDMGLSSGVLWARANIDTSQQSGFAESPFQYECSFFSWGNIVGHNPINTSTFDYSFDDTSYATTPGANLNGNIPTSSTYDAARAILGGSWRMPTKDEFVELINGCDFVQADGETVVEGNNKLVTVNNAQGIYLKSKSNGNLLFIAVTGIASGTTWSNRGNYAHYWSNTMVSNTHGYILNIHAGAVNPQDTRARNYGFPIRPVA